MPLEISPLLNEDIGLTQVGDTVTFKKPGIWFSRQEFEYLFNMQIDNLKPQ